MNSVLEPGSQPEPTEPPTGEEDVLGRRIGAALIDLALLVGLFIVLALTIGESETEGGNVSLSLSGGQAAVYFALVLLYYFALEAAIGQTVGKLLLGLRVVRADARRPSVAAIALRTLLRIVDWLPFLYLVGFITMMATGQRRLRLGDLAAKTIVARARPGRYRGLAVAPVALLLLLIVALSVFRAANSGGDSAEATKTYRARGISFDYPAEWGEGTFREFSGSNAKRWEVRFVLDSENVVTFSAWKLDAPVTEENFNAVVGTASERLSQYIFTAFGSTAYSFDCLHKQKNGKWVEPDLDACEEKTFDSEYSLRSDTPQFPSGEGP